MGITPFLLQKHAILRTDSQEVIREHVTHYLCPHRMRLFDGPRLASRLSAVSLNQLAIIELEYGANVEIDPVEESNVYLFRITLEGQGAILYADRQVSMVQEVLPSPPPVNAPSFKPLRTAITSSFEYHAISWSNACRVGSINVLIFRSSLTTIFPSTIPARFSFWIPLSILPVSPTLFTSKMLRASRSS